MKAQYNQITAFLLASDGLFNIDARYFQPYAWGRCEMAVLTRQCDVYGIDWSDYVDGLAVYAQLYDYPHTTPRFRKGIATRMLAGGALSVNITTWGKAFDDFHVTGRYNFQSDEVMRDAA